MRRGRNFPPTALSFPFNPPATPMSDHESSTEPKTQDTGFIPGDDSWTRWRNAFTLLSGGMSPEGRMQYRKARDDRYEEADIKRCEKYRDYLLSYSTKAPQTVDMEGDDLLSRATVT